MVSVRFLPCCTYSFSFRHRRRFLKSFAASSHKVSIFCSPQPRFVSSDTHMELVKAVASRGSISPESIAIRADQKSHSYHQLILSAKTIFTLLTNANLEAKILTEDGSGDDNMGVGELCIKSPSLFKEYWKLPEVTKESFLDGGFFKTEDAARVDEDGYYVILGRINADIMKVVGYKLSALEIEAVLLECCVLGLPDKDYGEAVCAIVVPDSDLKRKREPEPALTLKELSIWAKEKLAPYKLPSRLLLWESLPRNAMRKVNKKELKSKLADEV